MLGQNFGLPYRGPDLGPVHEATHQADFRSSPSSTKRAILLMGPSKLALNCEFAQNMCILQAVRGMQL